MSIDEQALAGLRDTLAADDYRLAVAESETGYQVTITAGPQSCDDCLVPKPVMRSVLTSALGVSEDAIELVYPTDPA